mgnify:FL=1
MAEKLSVNFFLHNDVLKISKSLIGKNIFTKINNNITSGMIVETEAYAGLNDKASHAYNNKRTTRTKIMYKKGGICYVYLCYGMHYLMNIVTAQKEIPHAILIRAIEPKDGIDIMLKRRNFKTLSFNLTNGPGKLSQALAINKTLNGKSLDSKSIWIEGSKINLDEKDILSSPRIGVDYAKEDATLLYRFYIKNKWVSKL